MRCLSLVLILLAASPAAAATYYVRKTGNNGNLGTSPAQAWLTIDHAANLAVAGDIVHVGAGTYSEMVTPNNDGTALNPIRFYADVSGAQTGDAGDVIINGGANTRTMDVANDDHHHWYYFKFTGGADSAINWGNSVGGRLEGCELYSSASDGIVVRGASTTLTLYQCVIRDNAAYGIEQIDGAAVTVDQCFVTRNTSGGIGSYGNASNSATIRRSTFANNSVHGIHIDQGTANLQNVLCRGNTQHGIHVGAGGGAVIIWHATSAYNSGCGIYVGAGAINLRNSIVAHNSTYGMHQAGGTLTHTYNCAHGNSFGNFNGTAQSTGETTANPLFWSASCLDLQDSSPCINTGTNPGGAVTNDIEGLARPVGAGYDMGCYEVVALSYTSLTHAYATLSPYAWWRLNEVSGSTASDQMNKHHGTYQNGVVLNELGIAAGAYNRAASFDGVNDKVHLGNINPNVQTMSFVGWIKADDFDVTNAVALAKASGSAADSDYFWSLGTVNSSSQQRLQFRFRAGGSTAVATASSGNLGTGAWTFVAGVYDGQAIVLYKDGVEVGRATKTGVPDLSAAASAAIGDNPTGSRPFDGLIDEVAIFTKALKPREIAAIYASALKGSITGGVVPKLWGVDEDDSTLFAVTNYNNFVGTLTNYGKLKWNNGGVNVDFGNDYNISSIAITRHGKMYLTCDTSFGGNTAPVLMSIELANVTTTGPNVVAVIGSVPTTIELRGLAIDPTNDELYALRSDGWLFVLNPSTAAIVRTVGQVTGLGDVCTTGEDLIFDPYGNLHVMDDADDEFYRVNKANGAILEAFSGGALGTVQGIAWDAVNSRILVSETGTDMVINASTSLTSASYITNLNTYGLTDIEALGFVPSEGRTGIWPTGVRIIRWQEKQ